MKDLVAAMTLDEARAITIRIKDTAKNLWDLLYEAHERKAWVALKKNSWKHYIETEFQMSEGNSYRLITQAKVIHELTEATLGHDSLPFISQETAAKLSPIIKDVVASLKNNDDPEETIREYLSPYVEKGEVKIMPQAIAKAVKEEYEIDLIVPFREILVRWARLKLNSPQDLLHQMSHRDIEFLKIELPLHIAYLQELVNLSSNSTAIIDLVRED